MLSIRPLSSSWLGFQVIPTGFQPVHLGGELRELLGEDMAAHGLPQGRVLFHRLEDVVEAADGHFVPTTAGRRVVAPLVMQTLAWGSGMGPVLPVCIVGIQGSAY